MTAQILAEDLPGQRGWREFLTSDFHSALDGVPSATIMVDELEFEIATDTSRIIAFSAKVDLRRYRRSEETCSSSTAQSCLVRLAIDVEPESGHVYEYQGRFWHRILMADCLYVGAVAPAEVDSWILSPQGVWLGIGENRSLAAVRIESNGHPIGPIRGRAGLLSFWRRTESAGTRGRSRRAGILHRSTFHTRPA
ncbi:hypothetical protein D5S19_15165 [Amycolatopsis panacis]|uniref:Uncharacterized protein n=1 Tax=Amycolatopsis panacis TaxID=2340917 RepID=A0A419I472_9PSEU|nr:hypothetical protein D5S19_15165 [Amycolatopsis panacis]